MPAAGARTKETKINLIDCFCLCSEVEIIILKGWFLKNNVVLRCIGGEKNTTIRCYQMN